MSGRKEERERLREERLAAQRAAQSSDKRRLYLGYAVAGLIVAAMLAGLFVVITGGDDAATRPGSTRRETRSQSSPSSTRRSASSPTGSRSTAVRGPSRPARRTPSSRTRRTLPAASFSWTSRTRATRTSNDPDVPNVKYKTDPPTSGDHYGTGSETASGALADGAYAEFPPVGRFVHSMEHGRVIIHYSPDLPEEDQLAIKGVFDESPSGVIMVPNPEMDSEVAVAAWTQLVTCDSYEGRPPSTSSAPSATSIAARAPSTSR